MKITSNHHHSHDGSVCMVYMLTFGYIDGQCYHIWWFPEMGLPFLIILISGMFHHKPSSYGDTPHFWKPPYSIHTDPMGFIPTRLPSSAPSCWRARTPISAARGTERPLGPGAPQEKPWEKGWKHAKTHRKPRKKWWFHEERGLIFRVFFLPLAWFMRA